MEIFSQNLGYVPIEFLNQPRFFKVGKNKVPLVQAWSNPENQKFVGEFNQAEECLLGFDISGHDRADDYLLIDFDHVLNPDGTFANPDAQKWFEICLEIVPETYCEISISRMGLHIFAKPTPGKFPPIANGKNGVLVFDKAANSKLELFYKTKGRYCLVTGKSFGAFVNKIASGEEVDRLLEKLLEEIKRRQEPTTPTRTTAQKVLDSSTEKKSQPAQIELGSDYDEFRAQRMLDAINPADLSDSDWLAVMSACKNVGVAYSVVDSFNQRDPERYEERENQERWDSLNDPNYTIETLHGIAKRFNYSEKDSTREWFSLHPELSTTPKTTAPKIGNIDPKKTDKIQLTFEQKKFLYSGGFSDREFADRMSFMLHNEIRYLSIVGNWLILERNNCGGAVWRNHGDKKSTLYPYVRRLADALIANAIPEPEDPTKKETREDGTCIIRACKDDGALKRYKEEKKLYDYQTRLGKHLWSHKNISSCIEMMKDAPILIKSEDLNKSPHLLNVLNGVVNLKTGELLPVDPNYLITNQANAEYNPDVDTSFVEKFLAQVLPDAETRRAVLRYLGYCLTGDKRYHTAHFWKGSGANGKSTVLDAIIQLFGSYVVKLPSSALLENRRPPDPNAPTPVVAQLDGDIRLAVIDELPRNSRLNGSLFKVITGDRTAYARPMYGNPRLIELRAKLLLNGNHLPTFDVDDRDSLSRRIHRVEYIEKFEGDRADADLPEKLSQPENLSALLTLLVNEAKEFYRSGLLESAAMRQIKEAYFAEADFIADFLTEQCIVGDGGEVSRKLLEARLSDAYPRECARMKKKEILRLVTEHLEALGATYTKAHANKNIFKNVKLLDERE